MKYAILILSTLAMNLAAASAQRPSVGEYNLAKCSQPKTIEDCFKRNAGDAVLKSELLNSFLKKTPAYIGFGSGMSASIVKKTIDGGNISATYFVYLRVYSYVDLELRGMTFRVDLDAKKDEKNDQRLSSITVRKVKRVNITEDDSCANNRMADTVECL